MNCIICKNDTKVFCDLGYQYPANSLDTANKYPLAVEYCTNCYHSQLTYIVSRKLLFDDYTYISGVSQHLRKFFATLANKIDIGTSILDIACNDGSFLEECKSKTRIGIEPCKNISDLCRDKSIRILTGYFPNIDIDTKVDTITAFNVIGHVENPVNFLLRCKELLNNNGNIWLMTSQANMVVEGQFDTIYHEHISYFSIKSFNELARNTGLYIHNIFTVPIHGGSYLVQLKIVPHKYYINEVSSIPYRNFEDKKKQTIKQIRDFCLDKESYYIGLGASAKSSVVMQAANIFPNIIWDENKQKIGHIFPNGVPITNELPIDKKYWKVINFTWNFFEEIWKKILPIVQLNNIYGEILHYYPKYRIEKF